jgi:hypothetical protein
VCEALPKGEGFGVTVPEFAPVLHREGEKARLVAGRGRTVRVCSNSLSQIKMVSLWRGLSKPERATAATDMPSAILSKAAALSRM